MKFKRIISIALASTMLLSAFAGCGNANQPAATATQTPATQAPAATQAPVVTEAPPVEKGGIVDGRYKYNETVVIQAQMAYQPQYIEEGAPLWLVEWAKDKMNIEFELEWKPEDAFREQFPLYMASGQYQPVLLLPYSNFDDAHIVKFGEQENIFQPLQDYFFNPEIMPILSSILNEPAMKAAFPLATTLSGNIYSAPAIQNDINFTTGTHYEILWMDTRVSDALGMGVPATTDEFLAFLRAVKEQDPMGLGENNVPLSGAVKGNNPFGTMLAAFGFVQDYFKYEELIGLFGGPYLPGGGSQSPTELGELVAMQTHPNFLEFLKYANILFSEELLEPEFFTLEGQQSDAKIKADYSAVISGWSNGGISNDSWPFYVPIGTLTSPVSNKRMVTNASGDVGASSTFFVTDKATDEQIEALMRFLDNLYDAGTEGDKSTYFVDRSYRGPHVGEETYGVVPNGWEFLKLDEPYDNSYRMLDVYNETNNPTGVYPDASTYEARIGWLWGNGGGYNSRRTRDFTKIDTSTKGGYANVAIHDAFTPFFTRGIPGARYPEALQTRMVDLETVLSEHVKTEVARFITGDRPCTEEEFATYGNELKALGYDEYCKNFIDTMNGLFR